MRRWRRLLPAVAPFRFSLPSTLPLCGVGAQRPFAGVHATTDANLCFSYHKSSITPSWCCHVGYRDVLHVRPQKALRSPFNERRIPVKTLLIHMFTASPDMGTGNKVWDYRIYSSRTPTSNALFQCGRGRMKQDDYTQVGFYSIERAIHSN